MVKKKVGISVLSIMISLPGVTVLNTSAPITANAATQAPAGALNLLGDIVGPILDSSSLSVATGNVGDKITITAKATDPSGVGSVEAVLNNIITGATRSVALTYDQATDTWTGTYTVAGNDPDGIWLLDFNMWDKVGNYSYLGTSNSIQINNPNPDTIAPTIGSIYITPQPVQAAAPLQISAAVSDNSAVASVSAILYSPSNLYVDTIQLTYDGNSGQWVGTYTLDKYAESGDWTVEINATDTAGNFSHDNTHVFSLTNPNGDTKGPTISNIAISATTVKPNDILTVSANLADAVSGLSDAYVTLWGPSGQSFSYMMAADQTTGLWKSDITIPGTFEPGAWTIDVTGYDLAGNFTNQTGVGTITVNNTGDYTPPQVSNFQATAANGQVTFSANVTDDKSTVSSVTVELTSPNGTYRYADMTYDKAKGLYTGAYTIAQNDEPGTWTTTVIAQDSAGNIGTTPGQVVTIANTNYDGTAPVLDAVQLSAATVNVGENLTISVTAHDDNSGVATVQGWLTSPSGTSRFVDFTYDQTAKQWVGNYPVLQSDEPGTWTLSELDITDAAGNTNYATTTNTYTVVNAKPDATAPVLDSSNISAATAIVGDQVTVTVTAHDDVSGVATASVDFLDANKKIVKSVPLTSDPAGQWTGAFTVDQTDAAGNWSMDVNLEDNAGNFTTVTTTNTITIDTSKVNPKNYNDAKYYFDNNNFYNAVYFAGAAIAQGDTRPEVQTLMNDSAQKLLDAAATLSSQDALYAYELLAGTTGVPAAIQSAAQAKIAPAVNSANYAEAVWYSDNNNLYNTVFFADKAVTDGDPRAAALLASAAQSLFDGAATATIYDAQNAYQLLANSANVSATLKDAAKAKLVAIEKFANADWYKSQNNTYNAVHFAGAAIADGLTNPEVQAFMNAQAQSLFDNAAKTNVYDASNAYQLLSATPGVPSTIKADADKLILAIEKFASAQWYNENHNLYNTVALASDAIAAGLTNSDVLAFQATAAQALFDAAATMSSVDAANAYQLLTTAQGVPATIQADAQAKLAVN